MSNHTFENPPIGTRDIDSLIPRKLPIISKKNISSHLQDAGFTQFYKDLEDPATEAYIKEINGFEVEIEFLTDTSTRNDKHKNVLIAGVIAQPLSYLSLSLQRTLEFKTLSGEAGRVVSPGAWVFHKGLTFTKRKNESKLLKDLYGIWYVTTQINELSKKTIEELILLSAQNPKWFETFQKNLQNWLENASTLDWSKLETQDPSGKLKKLNFEKIISKLINVQ